MKGFCIRLQPVAGAYTLQFYREREPLDNGRPNLEPLTLVTAETLEECVQFLAVNIKHLPHTKDIRGFPRFTLSEWRKILREELKQYGV